MVIDMKDNLKMLKNNQKKYLRFINHFIKNYFINLNNLLFLNNILSK